MKFSPSSSVSSSSTTSFSINFCASKGNGLGGISGFLSRILCSKGLPTYPSDPFQGDEQRQLSKIEKIFDGSNTPNVVARLMGLDYMPEIDSKDVRKDWRSKSMGSGEFREETEEMLGIHRRVKTSVSFRETPEYFELEDDDFFVLNFGNEGGKQKKGSNFDDFEMGLKGCKHRRSGKCRRKQRKNRVEQGKDRVFSNEERVNLKISPQHSQNSDSNYDVLSQSFYLLPFKDRFSSSKQEFDGIKVKQKKKEKKCLEVSKNAHVECTVSENSSPVSVLDDGEFISDSEVTTSGYSEEDAKSRGSEYDSEEFPCSSNGSCSKGHQQTNTNDGTQEKNTTIGLKRRDYRKHENAEMLRKICKLAEVELINSSWKYRGMMLSDQEFQDTGLDFSQQIFDQLVSELLDQLV